MNWQRGARRWGLLAIVILSFSAASFSQIAVGISVRIGPPPLPVYAQPICPGPGYLWTPGYWAWSDDDGYYWVPGTWVLAPAPGLLWTPGYWGFEGGFYHWHVGYWGPQVGFYGGVDYGFGYFGTGFGGGYWDHDRFFYNRSVTNVTNISVTNVYNKTVVNERITGGGASFNGGPGGIQRQPTPEEQAVARRPHFAATAEQTHHDSQARTMPSLRASANHGLPPVAATPRPSVFAGHGVSAAQGRAVGLRGTPQANGRPAPAREAAARSPETPHAPMREAAPHGPATPRAPIREAGPRAPESPRAPIREAGPRAPESPRAAPAYPYAQRGAPGPSYAGPAPVPYRESRQAPAAPPHAAQGPGPVQRSPQPREGGQAPRRESEDRVTPR
jgi:hypothetical protein